MADLRCLLLDMGRVLLDFDYTKTASRLKALTGLDDGALRKAILSDGLEIRFELGEIDEMEFHAEICRRMGRTMPFNDFADAWTAMFLDTPLLPEDLLADLASRMGLWIVSNTNRLHFEYILKRYAFVRHFRGHVVSYEVGAMKPDSRIYMAALNRAGVSAGEALFVDDLAANVEGAQRAGIDAFQYVNQRHFMEELAKRGL